MKTLKYAWRFLIRSKSYTIINVIGLALSLACTIILVRYIHRELQVNTHCTHAERTFIPLREIDGNVFPGSVNKDSGADTAYYAPEAIEKRSYFITLDNEFHKRLYTYAGYDRIWQAMHNVTTHMDRVRYLDTALCQMDMETFREEHEQLYKYLMVGLPKDVDVDAFFEHHLGAYREHFQSLLDRFPDFFI